MIETVCRVVGLTWLVTEDSHLLSNRLATLLRTVQHKSSLKMSDCKMRRASTIQLHTLLSTGKSTVFWALTCFFPQFCIVSSMPDARKDGSGPKCQLLTNKPSLLATKLKQESLGSSSHISPHQHTKRKTGQSLLLHGTSTI